MSKLVTGDGRTHIESSLMRESLVDRRVIAKTDSEGEFAIMPDVVLVGLGGQSIFDRGKPAVMPLVEELRTLREARKAHGSKGPPPMVLGVGGGTRVRHTVSVALDLGIPTGGVAQLVNARDNVSASYSATLDTARGKQDADAIATLEKLGPPPWANPRNFGQMRRIIRKYENETTSPAPKLEFAAEYSSDADMAAYEAGEEISFIKYLGLKGDGMAAKVDLPALGGKYALPMLFVQGEEDLLTRAAVTRAFVDSLQAPHKKLVMVPGAGHAPNFALIEAHFRVLAEAAQAEKRPEK